MKKKPRCNYCPRQWLEKMFKMMRIWVILLFLSMTVLQAETFSQVKKVSLNVTNVSLLSVLDLIQEQSGYTFLFSSSDIQEINDISLKIKDENITLALDKCLKGTGLSYTVNEGMIVLKKGISSGFPPVQQKILVQGVVSNKKGETLPGVSILLKGTSVGITSDVNGNFRFEIPEMQEMILIFSFVGMKKQEITYNGQKEIKVVLEEDIAEMDEVVVNGYFQKNKESQTGNSITIPKTELEKVSSQNILSALRLFDPSYKISDNITNGSDPNSLPEMRIRGNSGFGNEAAIDESSLRGDPNQPTFILDGYEVSVEKIYDLDLSRVESVTILKDASATAIYGSRAANGVIVIHQKIPESGKLRVAYNFTATLTMPDLSDYHLLNAKDKLQLEYRTGLYAPQANDVNTSQLLEQDYAARLANVLRGVNTYWLTQPLKTAFGHKHAVYVEGGDRNLRYAIDLNLQKNPGVMKGSERNRYNAGVMLSYNLNDILLFRNYLSVNKIQSEESPYGSFSEYAKMNPYYPIQDEEGNLIKRYRAMSPLTYSIYNPVYAASLNNRNKSNATEITDNFDLDWYINDVLRVKGRLAYSETTIHDYRYDDPNSTRFDDAYYKKGEGLLKKGEARNFNERSRKLESNVVLTYNQKSGGHFLNAALGGNIIENRHESDAYEVAGFANNSLNSIAFANQFLKKSPEGKEGISRLAGTFINANYTYNNLYLLDVSYRLDGSSQFGSDKRFAPFWSAGIGWNIHHENFFHCPWIDRLKITANLGQLGKASFSPYQSQTMFVYNRDKWYANGIGATVIGIGNNHLQWEKTYTYDANLEWQLLKGAISLNATYYIKNTRDLLADISLPLSNGFTSYKDNLGELTNKGFEFTLRSFLFRNKDWNVSIFASAAHNKNTINKISNSLQAYNEKIDKEQVKDEQKASRPLVQFKEGQSTTSIYAVKSLGINPNNGNEVYVTRNGELSYIWDVKDKVVCGDKEPELAGVLGANIDYKGFNLNFNFLYEMGGQIYNQTLVDRVENADARWNVDSRVFMNRWQNAGDETFFKRMDDRTKTEVSSRFVEDHNLLQLQNISLSYTFEKEIIKSLGMNRLKLSILMNDVFRASSVKMERGLEYPFARSFNFNVQIQF